MGYIIYTKLGWSLQRSSIINTFLNDAIGWVKIHVKVSRRSDDVWCSHKAVFVCTEIRNFKMAAMKIYLEIPIFSANGNRFVWALNVVQSAWNFYRNFIHNGIVIAYASYFTIIAKKFLLSFVFLTCPHGHGQQTIRPRTRFQRFWTFLIKSNSLSRYSLNRLC